ncbi:MULTISPECIES: DUF2958 domain-containing protein [unclassified Mesorhizobium]|uniref:DUF2958 domain-containing protein n=1 Tax=unclassified Mesorhizobium TaxID=325217 RepID=UPI001093A7DE|nr:MULTISPECIES: DUF2958 domain-containing protein [unclassified Mesorhizobium]TGS40700.1 DUF2958 domain-containing protein [Mesorhizobium sp. M8A.F.Ca.ET.182.01.1.1]TGS78811.1 DUF2958 domain-containing protein [Mesorhizobium sp. M8A.F.Ca.ET.181.01.1.1]
MLLTHELRTALRRNADLSHQRERDHYPLVKCFLPNTGAAWLFTELAEDEDTLFGLCDLGQGSPELGYASLAELQSLRGPGRVLVERDRHFKARKTLSEYALDAWRCRRIVA